MVAAWHVHSLLCVGLSQQPTIDAVTSHALPPRCSQQYSSPISHASHYSSFEHARGRLMRYSTSLACVVSTYVCSPKCLVTGLWEKTAWHTESSGAQHAPNSIPPIFSYSPRMRFFNGLTSPPATNNHRNPHSRRRRPLPRLPRPPRMLPRPPRPQPRPLRAARPPRAPPQSPVLAPPLPRAGAARPADVRGPARAAAARGRVVDVREHRVRHGGDGGGDRVDARAGGVAGDGACERVGGAEGWGVARAF